MQTDTQQAITQVYGQRLEAEPRIIQSRKFTSIRYGEHLTEIGAVPSIGTVGDSHDNARAEP